MCGVGEIWGILILRFEMQPDRSSGRLVTGASRQRSRYLGSSTPAAPRHNGLLAPLSTNASAPQPTSRQHTATASRVTPVWLWPCGGEQPAHRGRQQQSTGAPVAAPRCRQRIGSGNSRLPADTGWQLQAASATAHQLPGRQRAAAGAPRLPADRGDGRGAIPSLLTGRAPWVKRRRRWTVNNTVLTHADMVASASVCTRRHHHAETRHLG